MKKTPQLRGEIAHGQEPDWEPLRALAAKAEYDYMLLDDWMWMYAIDLENGRRIHAYKHVWTRQYLHLGGDGRAYVYQHVYLADAEEDADFYGESDPMLQVDKALESLRWLYWPPRDEPAEQREPVAGG